MKISIIIPVYNAERHLKFCLDSIVNQSLKDIEIIAIDDNSTDNSFNILKEYAEKYKQIKIFKNNKNMGQGQTRNEGIKLAKGIYIGFVDADDYINYEMYNNMFKEAIKNNYPDIISTNLKFVTDDNVLINQTNNLNGILYNPLKSPYELINASPSCCNKIFKNELIKDYAFIPNVLWEDFAFTYSSMLKANSILVMQSLDYFYRRDITTGVSSKGYKPSNHIFDVFKIADEIENEAKKANRYEIFEEQIKFLQFTICLQRIKEIEKWNINTDELKNNIYNEILTRYGDLNNVDTDLLSIKVSIKTINEFKNFQNKKTLKSN